MNILYLHGWGSSFDAQSDKVLALSKLGQVHGVDLDYTQGSAAVLEVATGCVAKHDIDLVVGTSMGGWLASHVGSKLGIPFVMVNPCLDPQNKLSKYLGIHIDHNGHEYTFTQQMLDTYTDYASDGCGLVLLDMGDDVINSHETFDAVHGQYQIGTFLGGSHRFEHMAQSLDAISGFFDNAQINYELAQE